VLRWLPLSRAIEPPHTGHRPEAEMSDHRRLTRKQLKQDHFIDFVQRAAAYTRENTVVVVIGVLVFVAAVAAAVRIGGQAAGVGEGDPESARALSAARQQFSVAGLEAGAAALEQVRTEYRRSEAGREATYVLANAYFEMGDWAKAEQTYREFLAKPLHDDLLKDGALLGIAACKREAGDLTGAAEDYRAIWESGTSAGSRIDAALAAARIAREIGQPDEARRLYDAVVSAFPDAPETERARFELLRLGDAAS
jgi:TolA-binding protein